MYSEAILKCHNHTSACISDMFKNEMKLNETDLAVDSYDRDGCNHVLLYTEG